MKNIYLYLFIFATFSCKSQTDLVNLRDWDGPITSNMYLIDSENDLNQFEGTWLYTDGPNTSLKIVLVKKLMTDRIEYKEDLLIGGFEYIKDGVLISSSLAEVNVNLQHQINHTIAGNFIERGNKTLFDEYTEDETRVELFFRETLSGTIMLRKKIINGNEAIQLLKRTWPSTIIGDEISLEPMFPDGYYTLIKQP